ncbi:LysR family transcriptional regulator [Ruegeria sp. HKCCD8929]|uniref:LysR family transcriptional regulator n=1 Tax=Ruegeria sp. HKCCD8929 TaxID=2683006 RepID=UPI0014898E00|nr:LysR family transcriptional regulator [Ruegeria sp. HKCCD8929]
MNETKLDWDDLRLFLAVARDGGLAAATGATGKSAPTLGRRILMLERQLGCELFLRRARGYELTAQGQELLQKATEIEDRILSVIQDAPGRGIPVIKISAGTWVTHILCAALPELMAQTSVKLRFIASDDIADIGRREALIGVRNKRPEGPGLAGRRIGRVRFATYATSKKVRVWARVIGQTPSARWVQDNTSDAPAIEITDPRNALDLTLAGETMALLPTFIGRRFDTLKQLSDPIEALDHDQWLVTHHEDRFVPEVRTVIDRTFEVLKRTCTAK